MTNRTLEFYGLGFGSDTVDITVTANGVPCYSGSVQTFDLPFPTSLSYQLDECVVLFTLELPLEFAGSVPMSVAVNSGRGINLNGVKANYLRVPNPIYTPEEFAILTNPEMAPQSFDIIAGLASPPFTAEDLVVLANPNTPEPEYRALLAAHGVSIYVLTGPDDYQEPIFSSDCRTNVKLDGQSVFPPDPRPPNTYGTWAWNVLAGQVLEYDLNIQSQAV